MQTKRGSNLALGILLILIGVIFLIIRIFPGLGLAFSLVFSWPVIIIAVGGALFLLGLLTGAPEMAIPACIVGGIGSILYWQNLTDNWESWSYIWTFIPGFVGIGLILSGVLKRDSNQISDGFQTIIISAVLFLVFGGFFGALPILKQYWPALLILLGLWQLGKALLGSRRYGQRSEPR